MALRRPPPRLGPRSPRRLPDARRRRGAGRPRRLARGLGVDSRSPAARSRRSSSASPARTSPPSPSTTPAPSRSSPGSSPPSTGRPSPPTSAPPSSRRSGASRRRACFPSPSAPPSPPTGALLLGPWYLLGLQGALLHLPVAAGWLLPLLLLAAVGLVRHVDGRRADGAPRLRGRVERGLPRLHGPAPPRGALMFRTRTLVARSPPRPRRPPRRPRPRAAAGGHARPRARPRRREGRALRHLPRPPRGGPGRRPRARRRRLLVLPPRQRARLRQGPRARRHGARAGRAANRLAHLRPRRLPRPRGAAGRDLAHGACERHRLRRPVGLRRDPRAARHGDDARDPREGRPLPRRAAPRRSSAPAATSTPSAGTATTRSTATAAAAPPATSRAGSPAPFRARTRAVDARVTDDRCLGCHSRSGRIALTYEGLYEVEKDQAGACGDAATTLHDGRPACRAEADVHRLAGLACVDCHLHTDLMGDGREWEHEEEQVEITCEACHGPGPGGAKERDDLERGDGPDLARPPPAARRDAPAGRARPTRPPRHSSLEPPAVGLRLGHAPKGPGRRPRDEADADRRRTMYSPATSGSRAAPATPRGPPPAPPATRLSTRTESSGISRRLRRPPVAGSSRPQGYAAKPPALAVRPDGRIAPAIPGMVMDLDADGRRRPARLPTPLRLPRPALHRKEGARLRELPPLVVGARPRNRDAVGLGRSPLVHARGAGPGRRAPGVRSLDAPRRPDARRRHARRPAFSRRKRAPPDPRRRSLSPVSQGSERSRLEGLWRVP